MLCKVIIVITTEQFTLKNEAVQVSTHHKPSAILHGGESGAMSKSCVR